MILKTLINIVEIIIIAKILYTIAKFFFKKREFGKNKKGKSISGKIGLLLSNRIHYELDNLLKLQKEKRIVISEQSSKNIIPLEKYKRKLN